MSRHTARENLFKLIYEQCVNGEKNALTFNLFFETLADEQKDYFTSAYEGINDKFEFLSGIIGGYSKEFALSRIYKVDLAILLISSYEILFMDGVPDAASINEALELAKTYSTEKSSIFINGVLASVKRDKEALLSDEPIENN